MKLNKKNQFSGCRTVGDLLTAVWLEGMINQTLTGQNNARKDAKEQLLYILYKCKNELLKRLEDK